MNEPKVVDLSRVPVGDLSLELRKRECAGDGHPPATNIYVDGQVSHAWCACGTARWVKDSD